MARPWSELVRGMEDRFMSHVSDKVAARAASGRPMTWDEWNEGRWNSYERKLLVPLLDLNALIKHIKMCQGQSQYQPLGKYRIASHYDEALIAELLPELLKRLDNNVT